MVAGLLVFGASGLDFDFGKLQKREVMRTEV